MPNITTILGAIKYHNPCEYGWKKLCKTLGTTDPETEVTLSQILDSNGVQDAFWALRCWDYRKCCLLIADVIDTPAIRNHSCVAVSEMPDIIRGWHAGMITDDQLSYFGRKAGTEARRVVLAASAALARVEVSAWMAALARLYTGEALTAASAAARATVEVKESWNRNEQLMREFCGVKHGH